MKKTFPYLQATKTVFAGAKDKILLQWLSYETPQQILHLHNINNSRFLKDYAGGVFDYFMGVITGELEIGDCPVIHSLLEYLKDRDIRADELFEICSHFRRAMIDFTYDEELNSKEIFQEISYIFDKNFQGVLQHYTDTIFEKEQEISRHEQLLYEYQKALDESAFISKTDSHGTIIYVNDKFSQLSGYPALELIGQKYSVLNHQDMTKEFINNLWLELKNKGIFRGTVKNLKKNGDYFYVDATIIKITNPYNSSVEYMSIANDVTVLIDARLEAQRASQAKEYFLSNMSHEIRTPLNAILGFVNLLIDQDMAKQHRKYLEIILNSGENLLTIINDILDFSKLRSGEFTIEPKIFSLHDEISHTLELFVASATSKEITITSFIDPKIPKELYADSLRINQILSNFLSNAIKFTDIGGHIHVDISCENNTLSISVEDDGYGISDSDILNIFSAFTQAENINAHEYLTGTGLGLSICQQLAKHMNGVVKAKSTLGKGSFFWLEIPVEVHNSECQIFGDMQELQALKIVFYVQDKQTSYKIESFLKYSSIFNIKVDVVDEIKEEHDIIVYLEDVTSDAFRNNLIHSDKRYISITSNPNDQYEKYPHIASICFPLYCSKIKTAFSDILKPNSDTAFKENTIIKFKGHILIAEDNEANQELIKILLTKYGLTYDLASNGAQAVSLFMENKYDLILMDEQMPVMDGNEAVKKILKYEIKQDLRHTPISALTANVIKGARERGLSSGFDSFLGKPIVIKELERVFLNYLKVVQSNTHKKEENKEIKADIEGFNAKTLSQELMLNEDEVLMLVELFMKKMTKQIPELKKAIDTKDYKKIAFISHSIKGSSGNFRMELLQEKTSLMEKMAKDRDKDFNYFAMYKLVKQIVSKIKIT